MLAMCSQMCPSVKDTLLKIELSRKVTYRPRTLARAGGRYGELIVESQSASREAIKPVRTDLSVRSNQLGFGEGRHPELEEVLVGWLLPTGFLDFIFRARSTPQNEKAFDYSTVPDETLERMARTDISSASKVELEMQTEYLRRLAKKREEDDRASGLLIYQYRRTVPYDELITLLSPEAKTLIEKTISPAKIGLSARIAGPLEPFAGEPLQEVQVLRASDIGFAEICATFCQPRLAPQPQRIEFWEVWRDDLGRNMKAATFVWFALDDEASKRFGSQFSFMLSQSVESTAR